MQLFDKLLKRSESNIGLIPITSVFEGASDRTRVDLKVLRNEELIHPRERGILVWAIDVRVVFHPHPSAQSPCLHTLSMHTIGWKLGNDHKID